VNLRGRVCYLLVRLRIHNPHCKHCNARLTRGSELLKRLEELNRRAETDEVFESKTARDPARVQFVDPAIGC